MAIRIPLALIGVISLGIGITLLFEGRYHPMIAYFAVAAVIIIVGGVLERQGYFGDLPVLRHSKGPDMPTLTKDFITDPETGHLIEIRYNPITGQQRYIDRGEAEVKDKAHQ